MTDSLIRSVSGVRGIVGKDLTPELVARYAAAFGVLSRGSGGSDCAIVLARDARTSGPMFSSAARAGLQSVGVSVIDCGLIPTPTAQLAVEFHGAAGGIVITASHNPVEWNALKFVGADGLFLDRERAARLFDLADTGGFGRSGWGELGGLRLDDTAVRRHLDAVLSLELVDVDAIRKRGFTVALDCVCGAGGAIMPALLDELGCETVGLDTETDGRFTRAPEPVPENLHRLGALVRCSEADMGFAVDPDVDRLAVVDSEGRSIGEDYTLAFGVESVLSRRSGPVVANLSTSLVVDAVAREYGVEVKRVAVGEANVAQAMRERSAVVGGEGNGGVMLPELHLGRDAPLAAALILDLLARTGKSVADLVAARPRYTIVKAKVPRVDALDALYVALEQRFADADVDRQDGLRLGWSESWLHVRPSGTEPIVRLIAEAQTSDGARKLVAVAQELLDATGDLV